VHRFFIFLLIAFVSCQQSPLEDCFLSTGPIRTKTITFPKSPIQIDIFDNIKVTWHESDSSYLILNCGRNLHSKIDVLFDGEKLELKNKARCNWVRDYSKPIQIDLYCPPPYNIKLNGFGNFITADTFRRDVFLINFYGTSESKLKLDVGQFYLDFNTYGKLDVSGNAEFANIFTLKEGKLNASLLKIRELAFEIRGLNLVNVWVTDTIEGKILPGNNLFYKGNPFIITLDSKKDQFISKN